MNHEWVKKLVAHRVADTRILRLIQKWLQAGVSEDGEWSETTVGTPQGAVVSPLLANVYLHYVFDLWVEAWRRKVAKCEMIIVRYADDLIVGFEAPSRSGAFPEAVPGTSGEVRFGDPSGKDTADRVRAVRRNSTPCAWRRCARDVYVPWVQPLLWAEFTGLLYDLATDGSQANASQTSGVKAGVAAAHARSGGRDGGLDRASGSRLLPISRGTGQPDEVVPLPGPALRVVAYCATASEPETEAELGSITTGLSTLDSPPTPSASVSQRAL